MSRQLDQMAAEAATKNLAFTQVALISAKVSAPLSTWRPRDIEQRGQDIAPGQLAPVSFQKILSPNWRGNA